MATKKFSNTKTISKENLEKVPSDKPGVYRIKSASNEVLYIGKAKGGQLPESIDEHKGGFRSGFKFQYRTVSTPEAADKLEIQEIRKHIPPRSRSK